MSDEINKIAIFRQKEIRKVLQNGEWWFVINDVVLALTDSNDPARYIRDLRYRDASIKELFEKGVKQGASYISTPLEFSFDTNGGKQLLKCWNTEGIFRLIQSIPSPKAEPFKRWLAKVGYERIQEIENPELARKRMKVTYLAKGYEPEWVEKRIQSIETRSALTDEWHGRGVEGEQNYAILTAEISKATFGITPSQHKKIKGIKSQNLRDNMSRLELLFTELGEVSTIEIAKSDDVHGMIGNKHAAVRGGSIAGSARKNLEKETGKKVITNKNFLSGVDKKSLK